MTEGTGQRAGSFERAIDLLRLILSDNGRSNIGAIAAGLGLPLSSAHRLVALLERQGFLVRRERGRYIAGLALATAVPRDALDQALTATGRPILKRLALETGHTAHLGVLRADMITYLVKEGIAGGHIFTRETMQLEAYCSGIGKMLLAQLPEEALAAYLTQGAFISLTERTMIDPALLASHLVAVREQDYAVDDREIAEDLNCLAVPIRRGDGEVIAAISVAVNAPIGPAIPDLLDKLRTTARTIEHHMPTVAPAKATDRAA